MSGTHALTMGDRGRLVIPAEVRSDLNWQQGTKLILIESPSGATLMSIDHARALLKEQIGDRDLIAELIAERHAQAQADLEETMENR